MISPRAVFTRARQPLLLGVGIGILVVIGAISLYLVRQSDQDTSNITRTMGVQNKLVDVLLNVRRAESAQRGFLISGQQQYLEQYRTAKSQTGSALEELKTFAKAGRQAKVAAAQDLLARKIAEMDQTIELASAGDSAGAVALFRSGEGRELMQQLRALLQDMLDRESQLLIERTAASSRTGTLLLWSTLFGAGLIVLIGAFSILLMQRSNRERQRALTIIETANADLEAMVAHRTADLTEANEEIQRFAYIVTHDLRSPLVNIMGFTSELEALRKDIFDEIASLRGKLALLSAQVETDTPDVVADAVPIDRLGHDFDEALSFIKASITKMDGLINAVLKLSREGRREFKPEHIDMTAMLRAMEASVTHQVKEANASVVVHDVPEITSDRLALEQVFSNLLDNAVKYLKPDEPGLIEISGHTTARDIIYQVTDNGRGIAAADHQRVFELFRRAGPQDRPGDGIGLAHVRALVRRLGGSMSLESEIGKGSIFSVALPRRWKGGEARSAG